ncbi:MAG: RNA polymerase sigma-70 factor (ECF subfamily) [Desulforhopalus sp.]|jgi:RNA polymerase sigma-70 factor (ECF subfamily)
MEISDKSIVEQVKQGEVAAYSELVLRYQKPIFNLMFRFSQSTEEASELTQDIFCTAFEKLSTFKDDKKFFPWLYTLAMNHGRDWKRKNRRRADGLQHYTRHFSTETWAFTENPLEKQEEVDQLFNGLAKLSDEKREILLLKFKKELSTRELGEIFGLSDSGVKMRISRALATLQEVLGKG